MSSPEVVIRSGPLAGRHVTIDRPTSLGRVGDVVIEGPDVADLHAVLRPFPGGAVVVEDLDAPSGTRVNGEPVRGRVVVTRGDRVEIAGVELEVAGSARAPTGDADAFRVRSVPGAELRYVSGTVAASMIDELAADVVAARRRLQPLVDVTGDAVPRMFFVDPFPDPDPAAGGRLVTRGSVVDAEAGEIWTVVTAEAAPEPPERALALLLGARLPAGAELEVLVEGYGMLAARTPDPDAVLRELGPPPFAQAGELRPHMARSLVQFLVAQVGEQAFLAFLAAARPGGVDAAAREVFRDDLRGLERRWRAALRGGAGSVPTGQFLRLALTYLRPYWRREVELLLLSFFGLAFTVVFPFALRALLDDAIPSGDFGQVTAILVVLGAAFAVTLLASIRQTYQAVYIGAGMIRDLRARMFDRLQALGPGWLSGRESGDVVARVMTDVEALEVGMSQALREGVVQALTLVVAAAVMMTLNPLLGGVVLLAAPLVALVYRLMGAEVQRRSFEAQTLLGTVTGVVAENLGAQRVVKAFRLEGREAERLAEVNQRLFRSTLRVHVFGGLFGVSVEMIVSVLRLVVLGLGAYLIFEGHLTIGGLVAFTGVMTSVLAPVTVLTGVGQQIQTSTGSLVRINEILHARPDVTDAEDARPLQRLQDAIELRDVTFSYTPERRVLRGVSARIPAGSRVAFVGPSGAGKSSILHLLMRFQDPDDGAVLLDGQDLRAATAASLRDQTGVVLQDTFLFNTTIRENIRLGRAGATDADVASAGRLARLDDVIAALPDGWDTEVGEGGGRLSGGQRQRVAIARALVRDPALLLLDEATSALDPRTEHEIAQTLAEASAGRTTVAITHRLHSVRDYDRIFVVVDGRIAEDGTHEELIAAGGTYAMLWDEQHGGARAAGDLEDLSVALARLPLFEDLAPTELAAVEGRLQPLDLAPGERLEEERGLAILARGRGAVLVPAVAGDGLARVAELRPGEAFGLTAVLGERTGAVLEADGPAGVLVLDDDALAALAADLPGVGAALAGERASSRAPSGGVRLRPRSAVIDVSAVDRLTARAARPPGPAGVSGVHAVPASASGVMLRPPLPEARP